MRELQWQERPNKKARLAGREARFRGERANAGPLDDVTCVRPRNHAEGTTATKRSQPVTDNTTPKKMVPRSSNPGYSSNPSTMMPLEPHISPPTAVLGNGDFGQNEIAVSNGPSGRRFVSHPQRNRSIHFRTSASYASYRTRSSPYGKLETAGQRRKSRERETEVKRLQKIEKDIHVQQGKTGLIQGKSATFGNNGCGRCAPTQSVTSETRPKEHLEGSRRKENVDSNNAGLHGFSENPETKGVEPERENGKPCRKDVAMSSNVQEPEAKNRLRTRPREGQGCEGGPETRNSERDLARDELVAQLMDDYTDSQTMVRNLRQVNKQHADKIETLNVQLTLFENRHQEDKLRTETQCAELKHLRGKHVKKLASMSERIEASEKRHLEDQETISKQLQQIAALNTQLEQITETRRLDLNQFERFKLDSHRELASQQQNLASCHIRLERLHCAISRQRQCLECSICLEMFSRPVTLHCGHTFCQVCIETNRYSAVLTDNCPLCRQFIGTTVKSTIVGELVELTRELEQFHVK